MRAVAIPMADPQLEFHWLPDPRFLIQGFLIQGLRRTGRGVPRGRGPEVARRPRRSRGPLPGPRGLQKRTHGREIDTVEALDKETLDKESRVWNPVELQLWHGHGYRHRPHDS